MWTIINDQREYDKALVLCKGSYQRNLLAGYENLSGSTLRGKARQWGGRYAESRSNLLARWRQHGIKFSERIGKYNRRILVMGAYYFRCNNMLEAYIITKYRDDLRPINVTDKWYDWLQQKIIFSGFLIIEWNNISLKISDTMPKYQYSFKEFLQKANSGELT